MDPHLLNIAISSFCHAEFWPDFRLYQTFIEMISSVILSESSSLPNWIPFIQGRARFAQSKERRLRRWLANERIVPQDIYGPLIYASLQHWGSNRVSIAFDPCMLWNNYCCLRLSIIYRGRAIPLAWKVIEHKSSSVSFELYGPWLEEVSRWLPESLSILFLADRAFGDPKLMKLCKKLRWNYRIRLKGSFWVTLNNKTKRKLYAFKPAKGRAGFLRNVGFTQSAYGPIHIAIGHHSNGELWLIASDQPPSLETFAEYGKRFGIEENFLDEKSNGFQLEDSKLRDCESIERLLLLLATSSLYLTLKGQEVVQQDKRRWVDPHWRRGLSYLKIGWKWVLTMGAKLRNLTIKLRLDGSPDPEPAIASKKQYRKSLKRCKLHCAILY